MGGTNSRPLKLAPDMAAFRLLVLKFVENYYEQWDYSPSYGEIVEGLGLQSNRTRVRKAVKSLELSGLVIRVAGHRGIVLPSRRDKAIRELRDLGFAVDEDILAIKAPVTNRTLPMAPVLSYRPDPAALREIIGGGTRSEAKR